MRTRDAGRITADMGLSDAEWQTFAGGAERIARAVREQTGLETLFHPHAAGFVETPDEIARFLDLTDADLIGLVFDTGHYLFGTGAATTASANDGLDRFAGRIRHIHLKDCDPAIASRAREQGWDYFDAVRHGVFSELGQGGVDFRQVLDWLDRHEYDGWAVVEQDILPGLGTPRESAQRNREFLRELGL
jgi:inosose dehydratase